MRKDPYAKERAELRQKTKGLSDPMQKFYSMLLENAKGEKGDTPVKGKDYFTPAERKEMIAEILEKIPVPKDADPVDYDLILTYITQEVEGKVTKEVAKIPKPKDGEPGKDAVVDIPAIVSSLLKVMPKMESKDVDYLGIKDYIDKEVEKIKKMKPQVVKSFTGGGATSLTQLIDADVSGLSRNSSGQYILGSGGGGSSTFTALTDTPSSYTSQGGKLVRVNIAEDALEFTDPPLGTGDVVGPASATNNNIALFDGTTGKLIKDSGVATSAFATAAQGTLADNAIPSSQKGANNGVAELDAGGKVPSAQLPSFVDDVIEVANFAALPGTGETGKIYVTLDTNLTYRWSGTAYVEISASLALGETSSTAYRGDRGKTAYDHSQITSGNPHNTAIGDISGLQTTLDGKQDESVVVSGSLTAALDQNYVNVATATYTDPSPVEGKGFSVLVRNGTATVGGTGYSTAGTLIVRTFHSGAWSNIVYIDKAQLDSTYQPLDSDLTTIAGLADPNADRILFWDDSAGAYAYLTASTGLTISGTNMTVRTSSATQTGIVELATDAETVTGTDAARATTPANITARLAAPGTIGGTTPGAATFTNLTSTGLLSYVSARGKITAGGNLGATETINFNSETDYKGTLDSNITFTFANATENDEVTLWLSYDGIAQRTITWPTMQWANNSDGTTAPAAPAASGNMLIVTIKYIGGVYYGSATGNYAVYS